MPLEVRYDDDRKVDEIVASDCTVHLERMGDDHWCLIIETASTRGHFTIRRKNKTRVETDVIEVNMRTAVETSATQHPGFKKLADAVIADMRWKCVHGIVHERWIATALCGCDRPPMSENDG